MGEYHGDDEDFRLDENDLDNRPKNLPPPAEISTSRKQSVDYFTKDGLILRTGYSDPRNPRFKERQRNRMTKVISQISASITKKF